MKCPHCDKSISFFKLRESFSCSHCGAQLKGRTSRVMLLMLCFGAIPWLLAESVFFGFNSPAASFLLLILSHGFVLIFALSGALEEVEKSGLGDCTPP